MGGVCGVVIVNTIETSSRPHCSLIWGVIWFGRRRMLRFVNTIETADSLDEKIDVDLVVKATPSPFLIPASYLITPRPLKHTTKSSTPGDKISHHASTPKQATPPHRVMLSSLPPTRFRTESFDIDIKIMSLFIPPPPPFQTYLPIK